MGGPLTKMGLEGKGGFVMTFSDVFLPVPFLASPFDLHRNGSTGFRLCSGTKKRYPKKNFCDRDFAELSGELFGVIASKPLFSWVFALESFR